METKDTCFCKKSCIDRRSLVLEILGVHCGPPMTAQTKKVLGE